MKEYKLTLYPKESSSTEETACMEMVIKAVNIDHAYWLADHLSYLYRASWYDLEPVE